jgi:hypothetical protein
MRMSFFYFTFAALSMMVWFPASAIAQEARVAHGTLTAVSGGSVTVRVGEQNMIFGVDSKTVVQSRGGASASLRAAAAGKQGPQLDELLQAGQSVAVTYNGQAGALQAIEIKSVSKASPSNAADSVMRSTGVIKAIGPTSITITGSGGGGAKFEQTLTIDEKTKVFGKGTGTAVAAKGGSAPFTDLVGKGDHVTVSYEQAGKTLHASEVWVTQRVTH